MQFVFGKAPLNYIDGVPAHKAGEWPGIKSCRFHSYKRVIRPVNCGIIFNENEPLLPPRRKLLGPTQPTPEYVFRPSCKMVPQPNNHYDRPEGLRYIPFPTKDSVPRPEKRHEFPYKRELDRIEVEKNKKMTNANWVRNEFKLLSTIGFMKQPYKTLTNQQLLQYDFTKDQFGVLKMNMNKTNNINQINKNNNLKNINMSKTTNKENRKSI